MTTLHIKEPWTMIPLSEADYFIGFIKEHLLESERLRACNIFPEAKISGKDIYLIQDDDEGKYFVINFYKKGKGKYILPLKNIDEVVEKLDKDHKKYMKMITNRSLCQVKSESLE